jgi:hypothetical protein
MLGCERVVYCTLLSQLLHDEDLDFIFHSVNVKTLWCANITYWPLAYKIATSLHYFKTNDTCRRELEVTGSYLKA